MNRRLVQSLPAVALLALVSGCASEYGYQLPDVSRSGGGSYVPYAPYAPWYYYGHGRGVYPGYAYPGGYGLYGDPLHWAGPYPYGYYYPYPRYVIVPCADGNHDGRCDRPPGRHDHDDTPRPPGRDAHDVPPPVRPRQPVPQAVRPPPSQPRAVDVSPDEPPPRHRQDARDERLPTARRPVP